MTKARRLRELLDADGIAVPARRVYNALSARQTQAAGFEAAYVSGYALTAAYLAEPDVGYVSREENVMHTAAMTAAADAIPLLVDIDGGYGNAVQVMRTVRDIERAGAAGVDLNDAVEEMCPHLTMPRRALPLEEAVGKIEAATAARVDDDFVIAMKISLKKTEYARSGRMLDEFRERVERYVAAGADAIIAGWQPAGEYEPYARAVRDASMAAIAVEVPFEETPSARSLEAMGFSAVINSVDTLYAAFAAHQLVLDEIKKEGSVASLRETGQFADHGELMALVRVHDVQAASERYLRGPNYENMREGTSG